MTAKDDQLKYLVQEYHDGLLLYEISNRLVWEKAARDEEALAAYFAKHKKNYAWDEPRFKGIAYHVKNQADVKAVKKALKGKPFDEWAEVLRSSFNADSVMRIRVERVSSRWGITLWLTTRCSAGTLRLNLSRNIR